MKYLKLFEDFNPVGNGLENRLNHVLNLIGISAQVKTHGVDQSFRTTDFIFTTDLNGVGNSMISNILKANIDIPNGKKAYIIDAHGGQISPDLTYYISKDTEEINDPTIICFREPRGPNAIDNAIYRLMKLIIEHFDNCTDKIEICDMPSSSSKEYEIKGIGKFISNYLKLNKRCKGDVIISKSMAQYFLKNSSADYNFYGTLKRYYPSVYRTLEQLHTGVNKSANMSDKGFGD